MAASSLALAAILLISWCVCASAQRPPALQGGAGERRLQTKNLTFVVSAKNLPNLDAAGHSDPFVKVYELNPNISDTPAQEFGKTEVIEDASSPSFIAVFSFVWTRGQGQKWNFKVRDEDAARPDEEIGEATVDVDEYVEKGEKITVKLNQGGELTVEKTSPIKFTLQAKNLPRSDPFNGLSDPYVKCYWRLGSNGDNHKFYTTVVLNDVSNADWSSELIEFSNYIPGTDQWLVFRVKDSDSAPGGDDDLGEAILEVDQFFEKKETKRLRLGKDGTASLEVTNA